MLGAAGGSCRVKGTVKECKGVKDCDASAPFRELRRGRCNRAHAGAHRGHGSFKGCAREPLPVALQAFCFPEVSWICTWGVSEGTLGFSDASPYAGVVACASGNSEERGRLFETWSKIWA